MGHQEQQQHHSPEPEHHLDLAKQVPEAGVGRVHVGEALEVAGAEGMDDGNGKQGGGHDLHDARIGCRHAVLAALERKMVGRGGAAAIRGPSLRLRAEGRVLR